ncbi:hypothetical protein MHYP_G00074700 [Metynnis hypsauchen]
MSGLSKGKMKIDIPLNMSYVQDSEASGQSLKEKPCTVCSTGRPLGFSPARVPAVRTRGGSREVEISARESLGLLIRAILVAEAARAVWSGSSIERPLNAALWRETPRTDASLEFARERLLRTVPESARDAWTPQFCARDTSEAFVRETLLRAACAARAPLLKGADHGAR